MGFTEVLTIIFILLKAFGVIAWSWWLVFLPEIVAVIIYLLAAIVSVVVSVKCERSVIRSNRRF